MSRELLLGDCLERLKELPDNSIDSIVTDPPYGLSAAKNSGKKSKGGFMGKLWDYDVPSTEIWRECYRVLKPGGHLLSFGGSRTYHRLAVNVEDAGFEIRDQVQWIYGQGFPKSHNIGKAIDKTDNPEKWNNNNYGGGNYKCPNCDKWIMSGNPCKCPREVKEINNEWSGWGTALKPAHEPIVMARKPLSEKTIVNNVLKHGTGGINIDESRIPVNMDNEGSNAKRMNKTYPGKSALFGKADGDTTFSGYDEGRFPANIILSEEAAENLDQHTGERAQGHWSKTKTKGFGKFGNGESTYEGVGKKSDKGGASRYFYVVKPSKKEKDFGMSGEEQIIKGRDEGQDKRSVAYKVRPVGRKNIHPTVKPIKLMEYLIKMVTPVGGTTLDPFMGSGTTGIAAQTNGFNFIGIEMSEEYMDIAQQRIDAWMKDHQTKLDI